MDVAESAPGSDGKRGVSRGHVLFGGPAILGGCSG